MKPADKLTKLIEQSDVKISRETDDRILADALGHLEKLKHEHSADTGPKIWRKIMKSNRTKLAAAAVIIAAGLIAMQFVGNPFAATMTFAKVVEPILNAQTLAFDFTIGGEGGVSSHEIVVGSRIRRTLSNMPGLTQIIDLDTGRMLALISSDKTAGYVDIKGEVQKNTSSYIELVRKIIIDAKGSLDVQELGEQEIDGRKAVGFLAKGRKQQVTIWADAKTALPIRIGFQLGQFSAVLKNFEFDVVIDPLLMSMDPPAGYTLDEAELDLSGASEQDFIESLRIWSEIVLEGAFPQAISTESYMKDVAVLGAKLPTAAVPDDEKAQLGVAFGRGMLFFQTLEIKGQWRYVGKNVKPGDANKAIFWYRPQGSETYRVIYGDLSAKDVAPEDLPK